MEQIFDFVMSNLLFVLIILGFLISVFNKSKRAQQDQPRRGSGLPGSPGNSGGMGIPEQRKRQDIARSAPRQEQVEYSYYASPVSSTSATPLWQEPVKSPVMVINDQSSPIYHPMIQGDLRKKATDGIMWAEVFGRPRAARPYDRFNTRK